MKPLRLLFLATDLFSTGGIERYGRYHIRALRETLGEQSVSVYCLRGAADDATAHAIDVEYQGNHNLNWRSKLSFAGAALSFVRRHRPDWIFCNHIQLTPVAHLAHRLYGVPYWAMGHGLEMWSPMKMRERIAVRASAAFQTGCEFTRRYMIDHLGYPADRVHVINNCVDVDCFAPRSLTLDFFARYPMLPKPGTRRVVMTVGRLDYGSRHKGHLRIMQAIRLLTAMPELAYLIVGGGPYRPELERMARELGMEERVVFTGRVPEEDLPSFYNYCDMFALVSEFGVHRGEGLCFVLIEAAACGKAVVAGNEDGSRETVEPGITGIVVSPQDIGSIADAIQRSASDPVRLERMGKAARERVLRLYSYPAFRKNVSEFIANCISRR